MPVIGRFRRAAQQPERKPMLIALPNHLRPRREKIFGPAPAHRLEPDDRVCMTLRWREMDSNFRFRREALSRFDLLRFIYVQKDQSDGGARKAKAKCGQHASRGNCSTACSRKASSPPASSSRSRDRHIGIAGLDGRRVEPRAWLHAQAWNFAQ